MSLNKNTNERVLQKAIIVGAFMALFGNASYASNAYIESTKAACNHLKECAKQNMGDVPEQYRAMIEQSLGAMCQSLPSTANIPGFGPQHKLYKAAKACLDSITSLTCEQIDETGGATPACDKLNNLD